MNKQLEEMNSGENIAHEYVAKNNITNKEKLGVLREPNTDELHLQFACENDSEFVSQSQHIESQKGKDFSNSGSFCGIDECQHHNDAADPDNGTISAIKSPPQTEEIPLDLKPAAIKSNFDRSAYGFSNSKKSAGSAATFGAPDNHGDEKGDDELDMKPAAVATASASASMVDDDAKPAARANISETPSAKMGASTESRGSSTDRPYSVDAEFALSVLHTSEIVANSNKMYENNWRSRYRRTTFTGGQSPFSSRAGVGAVSSTSDPNENGKMKSKAMEGQPSPGSPFAQRSSFDDRLRRKLEEGRSKSGYSRSHGRSRSSVVEEGDRGEEFTAAKMERLHMRRFSDQPLEGPTLPPSLGGSGKPFGRKTSDPYNYSRTSSPAPSIDLKIPATPIEERDSCHEKTEPINGFFQHSPYELESSLIGLSFTVMDSSTVFSKLPTNSATLILSFLDSTDLANFKASIEKPRSVEQADCQKVVGTCPVSSNEGDNSALGLSDSPAPQVLALPRGVLAHIASFITSIELQKMKGSLNEESCDVREIGVIQFDNTNTSLDNVSNKKMQSRHEGDSNSPPGLKLEDEDMTSKNAEEIFDDVIQQFCNILMNPSNKKGEYRSTSSTASTNSESILSNNNGDELPTICRLSNSPSLLPRRSSRVSNASSMSSDVDSSNREECATQFARRPSFTPPTPSYQSQRSVSDEDYFEFVSRKMASQGCMTYAERKRMEQDIENEQSSHVPEEAPVTPSTQSNIAPQSVADHDHLSSSRRRSYGRLFASAPEASNFEEEKLELDDEAILSAAAEGQKLSKGSGDENVHMRIFSVKGKQQKIVDSDEAPVESGTVLEGPMGCDTTEENEHDDTAEHVITDRTVLPDSIPPRDKNGHNLLTAVVSYRYLDGDSETNSPRGMARRSRSLYVDGNHNSRPEHRRGTFPNGCEESDLDDSMMDAMRELADMVDAQDVLHATLVDDEPIETVEAIPMAEDEMDNKTRFRRRVALVWGPVLLIIVAIAGIAISVSSDKNDSSGDSEEIDETMSPPEKEYDPTLVQVKKEGVLRCGVPQKLGFCSINEETGVKEGISVDFCKAVAAAVLGPDYVVDLVDVTSKTRFTSLAGREIDLLLWGDTHTMERDFHEKASQVGFQFTDPYIYDGLGFAGIPSFVQCADRFSWLGDDCRGLKICVNAGTTHVDVLGDLFPQQNLFLTDSKESFFQEFIGGGCNVIAGEQNDIAEISVRQAGYEGDFAYGEKVLSKEPLAMVTRKGDQTWTDVANWVLRGLVLAEMHGIIQSDPYLVGFMSNPILTHGIDFISALEAVGNYEEIYERNMEKVVPRKGLNLLYTSSEENSSGLLYAHPTGVLDTYRHEFPLDGKIHQILNRGKILCGISVMEAEYTRSVGADFCRALSASLFSSDPSFVEFVELHEEDLLEKLDNGVVDVVAGAPMKMDNDIIASNSTASGLSGLAFSQPYLYHYESHSVFSSGESPPLAMATSQSDVEWSTYVYWIVAASFWAEENGLTQDKFMEVPEVKLFGEQFEWMFRNSILGVGNYMEIYERNRDNLPPRSNKNLLNDGSSPQFNANH